MESDILFEAVYTASMNNVDIVAEYVPRGPVLIWQDMFLHRTSIFI